MKQTKKQVVQDSSNLRTLIDKLAEKSNEVREVLTLSPHLKEKLFSLMSSFPSLSANLEDVVLYYIRILEYFETYEIDQFDPYLERVEQKLERLQGKLNLNYSIHQDIKLKARQVLAF